MKVLGGHQPHLFPGIQYFARMAAVDVWVYSDDVKYNRHNWQNRNQIKGPFGPVLLTANVANDRDDAPIHTKKLSYSRRWPEKVWATIEHNLGACRYFEDLAFVRAELSKRHELLTGLICPLMESFLDYLDIRTPTHWATGAGLGLLSEPSEKLAAQAAEFGCDTYATGPSGWKYLNPEAFARRGITVRSYVWTPPVYAQRWPKSGFVPDLSILDLIANLGPAARAVVKGAVRIGEGQWGCL